MEYQSIVDVHTSSFNSMVLAFVIAVNLLNIHLENDILPDVAILFLYTALYCWSLSCNDLYLVFPLFS